MRCRRLEAVGLRLASAAVLVALVAVALAPSAQAQRRRLAPQLATTLEALQAEKAARTLAQRKLSSRLLYASKMRRGLPLAAGVSALRTGVVVEADGTLLVDLRAEVTPALLDAIVALGGRVASSHPRYGAIRARMPVVQLEALAAFDEVRSVRPADRAFTRMINVTEGDVAHRADLVRSFLGVDGTGVTVGVLSDGVDSLADLQDSGDLPANVTVLTGQAGSGSEGTAMLEIIHDLAPGADLLFATAFGGQATFAANILALRDAGAKVIVDDVGYFAEAVFQDDNVAESVDTVVADGVSYFSSAGNSGNLNDGTAGVWEGDYVFSGTNIQIGAGPPLPTHDFGGGAFTNEVAADSPFFFTLHWSDPKGASANDYDLFLVNSAGTTILDASTNLQDGDDDPFEIISSQLFDDTGNLLIITLSSGSGRMLHLNTNRGRLAAATAGQTSGHSAARGALSVAAVAAASAPGGVFDGSESVELFSSDGPRRVLYEADGSEITPGDVSSTGGELRQKPDLAAADGVSTATPGFATFFGTSAAAPHAAAVAALLLEVDAAMTPAELGAALTATALDIEAPGADRDAGHGIVDAFEAALVAVGTDCVDGLDNDLDGSIDLADPGCTDAFDGSEKSPDLECDDGEDDDGDGRVDFGPGDPREPGLRHDAARRHGRPGLPKSGVAARRPPVPGRHEQRQPRRNRSRRRRRGQRRCPPGRGRSPLRRQALEEQRGAGRQGVRGRSGASLPAGPAPPGPATSPPELGSPPRARPLVIV